MKRSIGPSAMLSLMVSCTLVLNGCSKTLIHDDVKQNLSEASHCSGSEGVDDSSLAVLPIPVVAFFVPHWNLNDIRADDYVKRCGEPARLVNRHVEIGRTACIPAALTRIISLGIWQWCPATVSWQADVKT